MTLAQADVIIPATGLDAIVFWSGAGGTGFGLTHPVESINGIAGPNATITVPTASRITFSLNDFGVSGDALALTLDGVLLNPTSGNFGPDTRGLDATSLFSATYSNILLSAGLHTFELFLTDACCHDGAMNASWSAAVPVPVEASPPTLHHRPRRVGTARLAQEAEGDRLGSWRKRSA